MLGVIVPYMGLYLEYLHFTPAQIGYISAVMMITRVIAPNIWGWLSDYTGRRLLIIQAGSLFACLGFALLFVDHHFAWIALVVAVFSFFWNAVLSQFEVITLSHLGNNSHFYSRIRLWGSVGFIVIVAILGQLFHLWGLQWFPLVGLLVLLSIWVSSLTIPNPQKSTDYSLKHAGFMSQLRNRAVICFLLSAFLMQISHGSYYTFYSVYLESLSYSRSVIGGLWALGVVAELVIFWYMHLLLKHFGPRQILLFTFAVTVARWWLIGCYAENLSVLIVAQVLHAFSFGTAHAVSIELVRRFFAGSSQGQGQALYSAASFGAGGAAGALISGWVWSISPVLSFAIGSLAAGLGWWVVWCGLREIRKDSTK